MQRCVRQGFLRPPALFARLPARKLRKGVVGTDMANVERFRSARERAAERERDELRGVALCLIEELGCQAGYLTSLVARFRALPRSPVTACSGSSQRSSGSKASVGTFLTPRRGAAPSERG